MNAKINELTINGDVYVRKSDIASVAGDTFAKDSNGLQCVIVAAGIGGIHVGFLKSKTGTEVELVNARRIQYWNGAASISEMAIRGVSKPADCRFSAAVPSITITQAAEIIPVSTKAQSNLFGVPVWTR